MIDITLHCAVIEWSGDYGDNEPDLIVALTEEQTTLDTCVILLDFLKVRAGAVLPDQLDQYVGTKSWVELLAKDTLTTEDVPALREFLSEFHDATTIPWVTEYEKEITV